MSLKELERDYRAITGDPSRRGALVDISEWLEPVEQQSVRHIETDDREAYWLRLLRYKLARSRTDLDLERCPDELEELFHRLAAEWKRDTLIESSMTDIVLHPAYQRIIGLGEPVVPLILQELQREPYHWFWALSAITGEDVAADEGSIERATELWLRWGTRRRLIHSAA